MSPALTVCAIFIASAAVALGQSVSDISPGQSGEGQAAGLEPQTIQEFQSLDRNRDGDLSPMEYLAGKLAGFAIGVGGRERAGLVFKRIDLDKSNSISLLEYSRAQNIRNLRLLGEDAFAQFHEMDKDGDGLISEEEFHAARASRDEALFSAIDGNGTGRIGPFEFLRSANGNGKAEVHMATADEFMKLDANDNGAIEQSEFRVDDAGDDAAETSQLFVRADLNGNGEIGPREFFRFRGGADGQGVDAATREQFADIDRNRDGVISLREFTVTGMAKRIGRREGIRDAYGKVDRNGNGEIDLQEYFGRFEVLGRGGGPQR